MTLTRKSFQASGLSAMLASATAMVMMGAVLAGCTPEIHARGNVPSKESMNSIAVGTSTRADVATALGTPSTTSMFDNEETWFYIGGKQEQWAFNRAEETERQVLAIRFDQTGVIESLKALNKDDGTEIAVVDRKTPTAGHEMTIIEQLLGNIGRFNPAGSGASSKRR